MQCEIQKGESAKLTARTRNNVKVLERIARRAKLTTEELTQGPIHVLDKDADGHAEFRHEDHAGSFTCHSKFFERATA